MRRSAAWASYSQETRHAQRIAVQNILYERVPAEHILQRLELNREGALRELDTVIESILAERGDLLSVAERRALTAAVISEVTSYGPLSEFMQDPLVTEILVNSADMIWIERDGRLQRTGVRFADAQHVMHVVRRILDRIGRRIDRSSPMVDARLPDGSRLNAIIAPLAIGGPYVTIRKFRDQPFTLAELVQRRVLTADAARFLVACIQGRRNIIVSGNTGSGKTTLLNVLSAQIGAGERVITIEDAAELRIALPHVVSLEAQPANSEGAGGYAIRDLVQNTLRMRPDRIVVGEVRDGAAMDMLQAMSTGHDGSLTTVHANSPSSAISRIETLGLQAELGLPAHEIRAQIAAAVHLIVHQARTIEGDRISRKVVSIAAILGMDGDNVKVEDVFRLRRDPSLDGDGTILEDTGVRPPWLSELRAAGVDLPF